MSRVITSLEQISQQYTVFAKDQVLTAAQLNSISQYLDDQVRLTRTALSGVGIADGLNVGVENDNIILSQGIGITADGDLFVNYRKMVFNRFKVYQKDDIDYPPFLPNGKDIPIFQLLETSEKDEQAKKLSAFSGDSQLNIKDGLFILFAESTIEDKDLCTGTDCDNGSRTYYNRMRLLWVSNEYAELFRAPSLKLTTEMEVTRLFMPNIRFEASVDTQNEWFSNVRKMCAIGSQQLQSAFKDFSTNYQGFISAHMQGNPVATWINRLQTVANKANTENIRLQYYYEFLDDVTTTFNQLIDELAQATPSALTAVSEGAKHLLLGRLSAQDQDFRVEDDLRSRFIASPIHAPEPMAAVVFYINKLTELCNGFGWARIESLKITPSISDKPSVPGFYSESVFGQWSYGAQKANKTRYLLGYHADKNKPLGGADAPLGRRQTDYDFYRIEGALGKSFATTLSAIKNTIKVNHLPISVTGILIEGDFSKIITPIFPFKNSLSQFEYLLKKDLSYQLEDVTRFSGLFKDEVVSKSSERPLIVGEKGDLGNQVKMRNTEINADAVKAISLLNKKTLSTDEKASFKTSLNSVVKNAGLFKNDVANVSSTQFPTMFDQIIVNPTSRWIDWLDILQKDDEKNEKSKAQLPHFLNQYPGFELSNGVSRGGTFVLIYNDGGSIIGTGMLSHYIAMPIEQEITKPDLPKFEFPLDLMPLPGIKIKPSFDFEIDAKLNDFTATFTQQVDSKIANNSKYLDAFRESIGIVKDIYVGPRTISPVNPGKSVSDAIAGGMMESLDATQKEIKFIDQQIASASSEQEKQLFQTRKLKKQEQVAEDIVFLAKYADGANTLSAEDESTVVKNLAKSSKVLIGNEQAIDKVKEVTAAGDAPSSKFIVDLGASLGGNLGFANRP